MCEQANAVWPADALHSRLRGDERFDNFHLSEHRRREKRRPRSFRNEIVRDRTIAHVRCGAQCRLPVSESPIPGGSRKRRTRFYQLLYPPKIKMSKKKRFSP